jgi:NodT family efflux transporter outer membrane factor (OMF) lipoprotein
MSMRISAAVAAILAASGCMVGPDYERPSAPVPLAYKELAGWMPAQPADAAPKGTWWSIYHDDQLDKLEARVAISNQNVKTYEAQYRQAQAIVQEARAQLFPTLGVTGGVTRGTGGGSGSTATFGDTSSTSAAGTTGTPTAASGSTTSTVSTGGTSGGKPTTRLTVEAAASWEPDIWGKIRRQVESDVAAAQVSAADLQNATLSAQGTLAADYLELRYEDSLIDLLNDTVKAYAETARITRDQVEAGTVSPSNEAQAETQLAMAQASLINVGVARGQYEHAIAVLAGMSPAELSIPHAPLPVAVPVMPTGLPSTLLQRRPDIAAAERTMQEQNALIGVQIAAFYPDITLSADYGRDAATLAGLFSAANRVWSLGANASETIFDAGERSAAVAAARAAYDASVATYRQTVLAALQQVEDELLALRVLQDQAAAEDIAVRAAQRSFDISFNAYQAGTVDYTTVVTAQTALLTNQQSALSVREQRLVASAALIQALGGGWDADELPKKADVEQ